LLKTKNSKWNAKGVRDPKEPMNRLLKLPVHSKTKSFIWLLVNHALPVRGRYFGEVEHSCPREGCGNSETISHALSGCPAAAKIITEVNYEWGARFPNSPLALTEVVTDLLLPSLCILEDEEDDVAKYINKLFTVLAVITYHVIWKIRCRVLFQGKDTPPLHVANLVWKTYTHTLEAFRFELQEKDKWWNDRLRLGLAGVDIVEEKMSIIGYALAATNKVLSSRTAHSSPAPYVSQWYLTKDRIPTPTTQ
jgi:hypothetical protein